MITILAVGRDAESLASFGASHPSIEVVAAHGAEDALERLARNRRIDAVLLLGPDANETAGLIAAEDPGGPPLFASADSGEVRGARRLGAAAGESVLEELIRALEPGSPSNEQGG